MPKVKANGVTFNFPEGATPEQISEGIDAHFAQQKNQQDNTGFFKKAAIGSGRGFTNIGDALGQFEREGEVRRKKTGGMALGRFGLMSTKGAPDEVAEAEAELSQFNEQNRAEKEFYQSTPLAQTKTAKAFEAIAETSPVSIASAPVASVNFLRAAPVLFGAGTANSEFLQSSEVDQGSRESIDHKRALMEGGLAVIGDGAGRMIFKGLGSIANKLRGGKQALNLVDESGRLTDDGIKMLDELDPSQLDDLMKKGVLSPDQAREFNRLYDAINTQPTRAQVTRSTSDFVAQQDASKLSGQVTDLLTDQETAIASRLAAQGGAKDFVGDNIDAGSAMVKPVIDMVEAGDVAVDDAYRAVRESLPDLLYKPQEFTDTMAKFQGEEGLQAVSNRLKQFASDDGYLTPLNAEELRKGLNEISRSNPKSRYVIKQLKNALDSDTQKASAAVGGGKKIYHGTDADFIDFDPSISDNSVWFTDSIDLIKNGDSGAQGSSKIMERYIDESKLKLADWDQYDNLMRDQLEQMGFDGVKLDSGGEITYQIYNPKKLSKTPPKSQDFFKEARKVKTDLEKSIARSKTATETGRRIKDGRSIIKEIAEGKVTEEQLFKKLVLSNTKDSIRDLDSYIKFIKSGGGESGQEALDVLKRRTVEYIQANAFREGGGEGGTSLVQPTRFLNMVNNTIGKKRLKAIFSPEEFKQIDELSKAISRRIPVRDTFKGGGPTGGAVDEAVNTLLQNNQKYALIRNIFGIGKKVIKNSAKDVKQANPLDETLKELNRLAIPKSKANTLRRPFDQQIGQLYDNN